MLPLRIREGGRGRGQDQFMMEAFFSACEWRMQCWSLLTDATMAPTSSNTHTHTLYFPVSRLDNGTIDLFPWRPSLTNQKAPFIPALVTWPSRAFVWSLPHLSIHSHTHTHTHTDIHRGVQWTFSAWLFLEAWPQRLRSPLSAVIGHGEALVKPFLVSAPPPTLCCFWRTLLWCCVFFYPTNCCVFGNKVHFWRVSFDSWTRLSFELLFDISRYRKRGLELLMTKKEREPTVVKCLY